MKFRTLMIMLLALLYADIVYLILNPQIYEYYVDYYFFNNRIFSREDENLFSYKRPSKGTVFFKTYYFNKEQPEIMALGFGSFKSGGRWSLGNLAKIAFTVPKSNKPVLLKFRVSAYVNTKNPKITVIPAVNGKNYEKWVFQNGKKDQKTTLSVPQNLIGSERKIEISFKIKGYKSPQELGYGADRSKFGIFLSELEIAPKF